MLTLPFDRAYKKRSSASADDARDKPRPPRVFVLWNSVFEATWGGGVLRSWQGGSCERREVDEG